MAFRISGITLGISVAHVLAGHSRNIHEVARDGGRGGHLWADEVGAAAVSLSVSAD